jgi:hypothetical protein
MTQLIGAICEKRQKIVLLSDRMVGRAGLTFERGPKGEKIANNAMVLTAGTVHEPELIKAVKSEFQSVSKPLILKIAKQLTKKYHETRLARINDEILRARGFSSIHEFYAKQKMLHDSLVIDINSAIEKYDLRIHLLLAGVDSEAHIYYIHNPGTYSSFDEIGFFCPGMGKEQAESTFVWYDFTPDFSLSEALYIAFEAKKKAETAGSVGKATDAWIIDKDGIHDIKRETIEKLENIYVSRQNIFKKEKFSREVKDLRLP